MEIEAGTETKTELERTDTWFDAIVDLSLEVPVIVVTACKEVDALTSAILFAVGLKTFDNTVQLVNLDNDKKLPSYFHQEENPDLVIIHCPLERLVLLQRIPEANRVNLLIVNDAPSTLIRIFAEFKWFKQANFSERLFHCLVVNVPEYQYGTRLFQQYKNGLERLNHCSIVFFGNALQHEDLISFQRNNYKISHLNYSLELYKKLLTDLSNLVYKH